ncbi:hypothetical protein ACQ4M3_13075 [Leptolyngbya sp. AN03gr2]|uniref:hypothetical protein n=1 Tax=unclassified Leptolyngbya TaxID=2650499 RepID=UPI003D31ECA9
MTPTEYWQAIQRFWSESLSPQEAYSYRLAGILAETQAREKGSSLLPVPWQDPQIPPTQLSNDLLIVLGLTALVLKTDATEIESNSNL